MRLEVSADLIERLRCPSVQAIMTDDHIPLSPREPPYGYIECAVISWASGRSLCEYWQQVKQGSLPLRSKGSVEAHDGKRAKGGLAATWTGFSNGSTIVTAVLDNGSTNHFGEVGIGSLMSQGLLEMFCCGKVSLLNQVIIVDTGSVPLAHVACSKRMDVALKTQEKAVAC
jgi:hypothetical protein